MTDDINIVSFVAGSGVVFFLTESQAGGIVRTLLFALPYFESMFACAFCTGFWVGVILSSVHMSLSNNTYDGMMLYTTFINGMGTAITSMLVMRVIDGAEALMFCSNMMVSSIPSDDNSIALLADDTDDIDTDEVDNKQ